MSLVRTVLRMTSVAALRGNTLAGDLVFDSDNRPLAVALSAASQQALPYIVVYTDADDRSQFSGLDVYRADRNLALTLEIGVATAVTVDKVTSIKTPATDEGMEAAVDLIETQAVAALFGDARNDWSELMKRFIMKIVRVSSHRGGSAVEGIRWAARRVTYVVDVIADVPPGVLVPETHPLHRFVELADNSSPALGIAADIITAIMNKNEYPDWRQVQAWLGLTTEGIEAIGLAPVILERSADEWPPIAEEIEPEAQEFVPSPEDEQ